MQIARVIGRVVATIKQDTLSAVTLQWIQPVTTAGANTGKALVAVDRVGVGPGEIVYFITSREAALTLDEPFAAVDAGIVGKVDWLDIGGEQLLRRMGKRPMTTSRLALVNGLRSGATYQCTWPA